MSINSRSFSPERTSTLGVLVSDIQRSRNRSSERDDLVMMAQSVSKILESVQRSIAIIGKNSVQWRLCRTLKKKPASNTIGVPYLESSMRVQEKLLASRMRN